MSHELKGTVRSPLASKSNNSRIEQPFPCPQPPGKPLTLRRTAGIRACLCDSTEESEAGAGLLPAQQSVPEGPSLADTWHKMRRSHLCREL